MLETYRRTLKTVCGAICYHIETKNSRAIYKIILRRLKRKPVRTLYRSVSWRWAKAQIGAVAPKKKKRNWWLCLINRALSHEDDWGSGGIAPSF
jgi:hypothetical protein